MPYLSPGAGALIQTRYPEACAICGRTPRPPHRPGTQSLVASALGGERGRQPRRHARQAFVPQDFRNKVFFGWFGSVANAGEVNWSPRQGPMAVKGVAPPLILRSPLSSPCR